MQDLSNQDCKVLEYIFYHFTTVEPSNKSCEISTSSISKYQQYSLQNWFLSKDQNIYSNPSNQRFSTDFLEDLRFLPCSLYPDNQIIYSKLLLWRQESSIMNEEYILCVKGTCVGWSVLLQYFATEQTMWEETGEVEWRILTRLANIW